MRGEVLDYDGESGSGLISGADGVRYSFDRGALVHPVILRAGLLVDFVPEGAVAKDILLVRSPESEAVDLGVWGYFAKCMRLYFNGTGRARRKEYWSFVLFRAVFIVLTGIIAGIGLGIAASSRAASLDDGTSASMEGLFFLAWLVLGLPFLAPYFSVAARRMHDVGMSGWLVLITLIPFLGGLFMFVVSLLPSQEGANQYGPYPKPKPF